jgi:hypothetical protein
VRAKRAPYFLIGDPSIKLPGDPPSIVKAVGFIFNGLAALAFSLVLWKMTHSFWGWLALALPGAALVLWGWWTALRATWSGES